MCFARRRRAIFLSCIFQKYSEHGVFATFDFQMRFARRRRAIFSSCVFQKCSGAAVFFASRAGGVPIFVQPSARRVRTRRFSKPTFRASWTHNLRKNTAFGDFPNISRARICCLPDSLTSLICYIFCYIFLFSDISDLLSPDSRPCLSELTYLSCPKVGSLTSKFPSIIYNIYIINLFIYTSSTAQGGGGSFKNRKPIGEIGCCESGLPPLPPTPEKS